MMPLNSLARDRVGRPWLDPADSESYFAVPSRSFFWFTLSPRYDSRLDPSSESVDD